jgi:hypothetical protein
MADRKFPTHPILEKLSGADAIRLLGYFGGTAQGAVKVYPSLDDLSVHYQIREIDILHVEDAPADELPHGGSVIWVKADAPVERCATQRTSIEARFLTGEIAARMVKGPAVAYRSFAQQQIAPEKGGDGFSVWPCSWAWGACLASNDMPCANTKRIIACRSSARFKHASPAAA